MRLSRRLSLVTAFALLLGGSLNRVSAEGDMDNGRDKPTDAEADTGSLIVHAQGLSSDEGGLRFVLFDSKKDFLKRPVRSAVVEIDDRQGIWTVEDLAYGVYAVLVHHDVDASGKMERHWYGKPKEPTGASNNAPARFGPPKFKNAKFRLDTPELTLTITVK